MRNILASFLVTVATVKAGMRIAVIDEDGNLTFHDGDQFDEILAESLSGDAHTDNQIMGMVGDVAEMGSPYV